MFKFEFQLGSLKYKSSGVLLDVNTIMKQLENKTIKEIAIFYMVSEQDIMNIKEYIDNKDNYIFFNIYKLYTTYNSFLYYEYTQEYITYLIFYNLNVLNTIYYKIMNININLAEDYQIYIEKKDKENLRRHLESLKEIYIPDIKGKYNHELIEGILELYFIGLNDLIECIEY
jgi:ABC-type dipeptide/oligopeptide/nickel transport system ATPase component